MIGTRNEQVSTYGYDIGKAYTFRWDGSSWEEEEIITPDGKTDTWRFGQKVAVSDELVLIGWSYNEKVYVYYSPDSDSDNDDPVLASSEGTDFDDEDLTVSPVNSADADSDPIYNIIAWYKDATPYQGLLLPFDDGTATDYSGNANTVSGNATYTISERDGTGAYSFSGNTYLAAPTDASISMTTATDDVVAKSFWMKTRQKAWRPLMIKQKEYGITSGNNGGFIIYSWGDNSGEIGSGYADNAWHHVVGVFAEGSEYRVYVDGVLIGAKATVDTSASSSYDLEIGSERSIKSYFKGTMDDVIVFNHDLSDTQVQALYDSYVTGANPFETIVADETTAGETWYAEVTPTDGTETDVTKQSNAITIIAP